MELIFFLQLLLLPILLFISTSLYRSSTARNKQINKGFKSYPILGALPDFLNNYHRYLDWTTDILRDRPSNTAVFHQASYQYGVLTANPQNVEYIVKTNFENYPKGDQFVTFLEDFFGRGIFNSDGDQWKVQRKTASHEFNTKSLRNFTVDTIHVELSKRLLPVLAKAAKSTQLLDLQDVFQRLAFDNICKLVFNVDPACLGGDDASGGDEIIRAFEDASKLSCGRFTYAFPLQWKFSRFLNIGSEKALKRSIQIVHDFVDKVICSRLGKKANKDEDLLSQFLGNNEHSPQFLRDIVINLLSAGRDSTSGALSWLFWFLSQNPHVETKILNELEAIRARNGKKIGEIYSFEELREMHYLHATLSETLRLYPPVPVNLKTCLKDDTLPDGTFIGAGWSIEYNSYAMARLKNIWGENCCEFVPERWLENGICKQESPFKFPVFHGGPRMCLGKDMSYIQMKAVVASVIERFKIDVQNRDKCPENSLSLTLRMKGGLPVIVKERSVDMMDCHPELQLLS